MILRRPAPPPPRFVASSARFIKAKLTLPFVTGGPLRRVTEDATFTNITIELEGRRPEPGQFNVYETPKYRVDINPAGVTVVQVEKRQARASGPGVGQVLAKIPLELG